MDLLLQAQPKIIHFYLSFFKKYLKAQNNEGGEEVIDPSELPKIGN